jgi:hypothetical protein
MLKGNIPLDRDFNTRRQKKKPKAAAQPVLAPVELDTAQDVKAPKTGAQGPPTPIVAVRPAVKHAPFGELLYELFDKMQASRDIDLLHAIAQVIEDYGH